MQARDPSTALGPPERARIAAAVRGAEARSSAEIVVMVAGCSGGYRSVALAGALLVALAVPWPLVAYSGLPASRILLVQLVATLAALLAFSARRVRLALVPRGIRRARCREAAARAFWSQGVSRTRERAGLLIYVALAERYAEIVADEAITALVPEETWRAPLARLLDELARGAIADGLVATVAEAGGILAPHLPPGEGDTNELPDRVILMP